MNVLDKIKNSEKIALTGSIAFLCIFFAVGIIGIQMEETNALFIKLIPVALLLSSAFVFYFHTSFDLKTILVFSLVYFLGLLIEIIGVDTKLIFGHYEYGNGLGIKLFHTPLIIGLNWLMLVYMSTSAAKKIISNSFLQMVLAASLLLAYDIILEQMAPVLQMWYWKGDRIPLQNYIAWFVIALFFNFLFYIFKIKTSNKIAPFVLLFQTCFFLILWVLNNY